MNLFATALKLLQMYSAAAVEFELVPRRAWRSEAEQVKEAMVVVLSQKMNGEVVCVGVYNTII